MGAKPTVWATIFIEDALKLYMIMRMPSVWLIKFAWREFLGGEKERGSAGLTEKAAYERVIFGLENKLEEFKGIQQQCLNHIVKEAED